MLNHQGSDENYKKILELLPPLRAAYSERFAKALQDVGGNIEETVETCDKTEVSTVVTDSDQLVQKLMTAIRQA